MDKPALVHGTQSLQRMLHLLRIVTLYSSHGISVADLARHSGISRPTVSRMIACMVAEGFVQQNAQTRRFQLGHEAINLGVSAFSAIPLVERYALAMTRMARRSGDMVFLLFRQSDFAVCLHRASYDVTVDPSRMKVGERRMLGIGAGGVALLAKLPDEEIEEIYQRNKDAYAQAGMTRQALRRRVEQTRADGYGTVVNSAIEGAAGVGVAFPGFTYPWAAISIGTEALRFTASHCAEMVDLLHSELERLRRQAATNE